MSRTSNSLAEDRHPEARAAEDSENSLRPARRRGKGASTPDPEQSPPRKKESRRAAAEVPEDVRKRFVQIKNAYFFADGARAFTDRGNRLTTPSENTEVVRSLVSIAQARGWGEVVVRGTERFRREAWAAARTAGLEVRGYKPTEFEQGRLVRTMGNGRSETRDEPEKRSTMDRGQRERSERPEGLLKGTLIEHGRAPYRNDMKEPISYFVKVETAKGERTIWGVDLERALKESLSRPVPGDRVGMRAVRQDPVTVKTAQRDSEGRIVSQPLETHRNRWIVEKQDFFEERARAARTLRDVSIDPKQGSRQHPELAGTYLQVRAAELASKEIRDKQDQKRFVEKVREALAASVARGEPLPPVRLRGERTAEPPQRSSRTPEPALARA